MIAKHLRVKDKTSVLVINKIDGLNADVAAADFLSSASQRLNTRLRHIIAVSEV